MRTNRFDNVHPRTRIQEGNETTSADFNVQPEKPTKSHQELEMHAAVQERELIETLKEHCRVFQHIHDGSLDQSHIESDASPIKPWRSSPPIAHSHCVPRSSSPFRTSPARSVTSQSATFTMTQFADGDQWALPLFSAIGDLGEQLQRLEVALDAELAMIAAIGGAPPVAGLPPNLPPPGAVAMALRADRPQAELQLRITMAADAARAASAKLAVLAPTRRPDPSSFAAAASSASAAFDALDAQQKESARLRQSVELLRHQNSRLREALEVEQKESRKLREALDRTSALLGAAATFSDRSRIEEALACYQQAREALTATVSGGNIGQVDLDLIRLRGDRGENHPSCAAFTRGITRAQQECEIKSASATATSPPSAPSGSWDLRDGWFGEEYEDALAELADVARAQGGSDLRVESLLRALAETRRCRATHP